MATGEVFSREGDLMGLYNNAQVHEDVDAESGVNYSYVEDTIYSRKCVRLSDLVDLINSKNVPLAVAWLEFDISPEGNLLYINWTEE